MSVSVKPGKSWRTTVTKLGQRLDPRPGESGLGRTVLVRLGRVARSAALAGLLAWCVVAALSAFRLLRPPDPIADLDAEFSALAEYLPPRGLVGFLDRYADGGTDDAARTWFTAQYALAPRVVVSRVGPEFLIVARGAAQPGGDPRLDGYTHIETVAGGHRLYRRNLP